MMWSGNVKCESHITVSKREKCELLNVSIVSDRHVVNQNWNNMLIISSIYSENELQKLAVYTHLSGTLMKHSN
jgi:hypothetical protein